jgi:leader peptidase (prepilin peptidase) / N-methyltransferase
MPFMMYALVLLCLFVTLYDLRYRRVPNWITLPLMLIGFVANFPGAPALWFGSTLLLTAWGSGWMGGGDVKLWVGLLWCTFSFCGDVVALVMFITLIVTSMAQILVRVLVKKKDVMGIKLPGAWRSLAFLIFLSIYPASGLDHVVF